MIDLVRKQREEEYFGVKELSDAAERLLRAVGPTQERGTVAEYPNERTIRYYLSEGLIPPPDEKRGLTSVFGYLHFLSLLAIKKLQADGLPISIIRTLIAGKKVIELEELLNEQITVFTDRRSLEEFQQRTRSKEKVVEIDDVPGREELIEARPQAPPNAAKSFLETLLLRKPATDDNDVSFSVIPQDDLLPDSLQSVLEPIDDEDVESWQRHQITPGLELHISDLFDREKAVKQKRKLLQMIKKIIGI